MFKDGVTLEDITKRALEWVRSVRHAGSSWNVLPEPSREELRPNLRNADDAPWHKAKAKLAESTEDLTTIYRVTPQRRAAAMDQGITRWTDSRCSASVFGIGGSYARLVDAILDANHSDSEVVFPSKVTSEEYLWRSPVAAEFYVDFETVSDLDDDFSSFPNKGGTPMIFMIGMGWLSDSSDPRSWQFKSYTAKRLRHSEELRIVVEWLADLKTACIAQESSLDDARIFHWSPAETASISTAYNSASRRHGTPGWDSLPWVDLLKHVVKGQPVTVKGAWGFGLKAISKALYRAGLTESDWEDGPMDGLGAMVGAWRCESEAERTNNVLPELDLMREIERYNEVDCRVMAEILHFLRSSR